MKPEYVRSRAGNLILFHNGFRFTKSGETIRKSIGLKISWRCAFKTNGRYACRAKAYTYHLQDFGEVVDYNGTHCHNQVVEILCNSPSQK